MVVFRFLQILTFEFLPLLASLWCPEILFQYRKELGLWKGSERPRPSIALRARCTSTSSCRFGGVEWRMPSLVFCLLFQFFSMCIINKVHCSAFRGLLVWPPVPGPFFGLLCAVSSLLFGLCLNCHVPGTVLLNHGINVTFPLVGFGVLALSLSSWYLPRWLPRLLRGETKSWWTTATLSYTLRAAWYLWMHDTAVTVVSEQRW